MLLAHNVRIAYMVFVIVDLCFVLLFLYGTRDGSLCNN